MRVTTQSFLCAGLLLIGYVFGSLGIANPAVLRGAPANEPAPLSAPVRDKVREADRAIAETMQFLVDEKLYVPAIQGLNAFAVSVGGLDAIADLESGAGVDPETFAGLHAGQAVAEVAEHLSRDAEGRITYRNKVVRMYNPSRLRQLFRMREDLGPVSVGTAKKPSPPKKADKPAEEKEQ